MSWQDAVVGALALAALAWLVLRRVRRPRRASPVCDGCPGCGAADACGHPEGPIEPNLISLDDLTREGPRPKP